MLVQLAAVSDDGDDADGFRAPGDAFTIVLLLNLTRLGMLRVDLTVQDDRLTVRFMAEETEALDLLRAAAPQLEAELADDGLTLTGLALRQVGEAGIAVADLIPPDRAVDSEGRLNVHA